MAPKKTPKNKKTPKSKSGGKKQKKSTPRSRNAQVDIVNGSIVHMNRKMQKCSPSIFKASCGTGIRNACVTEASKLVHPGSGVVSKFITFNPPKFNGDKFRYPVKADTLVGMHGGAFGFLKDSFSLVLMLAPPWLFDALYGPKGIIRKVDDGKFTLQLPSSAKDFVLCNLVDPKAAEALCKWYSTQGRQLFALRIKTLLKMNGTTYPFQNDDEATHFMTYNFATIFHIPGSELHLSGEEYMYINRLMHLEVEASDKGRLANSIKRDKSLFPVYDLESSGLMYFTEFYFAPVPYRNSMEIYDSSGGVKVKPLDCKENKYFNCAPNFSTGKFESNVEKLTFCGDMETDCDACDQTLCINI